jgi:hypothetical protein
LQEVTASTVGPEVWPVFSGDPNRQGLRLLYPETATDALQATMQFELERGRPMFKWNIENSTDVSVTTSLASCSYEVLLTPTTFAYWTAGSTAERASVGNSTETVAGDADALNTNWVSTTTGAPAAASIICGFARKKVVDCNHIAVDNTTHYDSLTEQFDNVSVGKGRQFESVWCFCGRYDKLGSRTPTQLGSEALARVTMHETIIPRT